MQLSHELHVIRAHLLHFETLLEDFTKTIEFVRRTKNPSLLRKSDDPKDEEVEKARIQSHATMERECGNMLTEIYRLEQSRDMQDKRVKNVMDLVRCPSLSAQSLFSYSLSSDVQHGQH